MCEEAPLTCSTTLGSSTPPPQTTLVGTTRGSTLISTTVRGTVWQAWLATAVVIHIKDHPGAAMLQLPLLLAMLALPELAMLLPLQIMHPPLTTMQLGLLKPA